jgi:hypothetical protein
MSVANVYLRVNRRLLLLPNPPTADQPNPQPSQPPPGTTGNLNIIAAELPHLQKFAGNTVDWLLRVARLLLDPRGVGVLHTFQTGTVRRWLDREMDGSWRQVRAGERLVPTIYEYRRLDGQAMELTRICDYHDKAKSESMRSLTTRHEKEFRKALLVRDLQCIVSQLSPLRMLSAARLIPRCLGDNGVQYIFQRFTGLSTPVTTYHQSMGVTVNLYLADLVDTFELGFWDMGNVGLLSLRTYVQLMCLSRTNMRSTTLKTTRS